MNPGITSGKLGRASRVNVPRPTYAFRQVSRILRLAGWSLRPIRFCVVARSPSIAWYFKFELAWASRISRSFPVWQSRSRLRNSGLIVMPFASRTDASVSPGGGAPVVSNEFDVNTTENRPSAVTFLIWTPNSCTGSAIAPDTPNASSMTSSSVPRSVCFIPGRAPPAQRAMNGRACAPVRLPARSRRGPARRRRRRDGRSRR